MEVPHLLTIPEAAVPLRCCAKTVRKLINDRQLGLQIVRGKHFVRDTDIAAYLDGNYTPATDSHSGFP